MSGDSEIRYPTLERLQYRAVEWCVKRDAKVRFFRDLSGNPRVRIFVGLGLLCAEASTFLEAVQVAMSWDKTSPGGRCPTAYELANLTAEELDALPPDR